MVDAITLAATWLDVLGSPDAVIEPQTYAGVFFAVPILMGVVVLAIVAVLSALVVIFGFLGQGAAVSVSFATVLVGALLVPRLLRRAGSLLPGPWAIRLRGPPAPLPSATRVGQKAATLASLIGRGENVPPAVVLSSRFFGRVARDLRLEEIRPERRAETIRQTPFSPRSRRLLLIALRSVGSETIVVRSSFAGEDEVEACSAGVYRSVTDIDASDLDAVEDSVRAVYASYWSEGARAYRQAKGQQEPAIPRLAVLLQRQVAHDLRGHATSVDPVTGRDDRVRVEAWGADGRGSGWFLDAGSGDPRGFAGSKEVRATAGRIGPELLAAVRRVEKCVGARVESEWGLIGEELCLYQARPSVRVPTHLVYSNGRYGEAIPRALTPLSESVLVDGIDWNGMLATRLTRLGLEQNAPPRCGTGGGGTCWKHPGGACSSDRRASGRSSGCSGEPSAWRRPDGGSWPGAMLS